MSEDIDSYIRSSYSFKEINTYTKELSLETKERISVEVIKRALKLCRQVH